MDTPFTSTEMPMKRVYEYYTMGSFFLTQRQHFPEGQSDDVKNRMIGSVWQELRGIADSRHDAEDGTEMVRLFKDVHVESDSD